MKRAAVAFLGGLAIGAWLGIGLGVRAARTPWPPEAMQREHEEPAQGHAPVHGPANDWVESMMDEIDKEDADPNDE